MSYLVPIIIAHARASKQDCIFTAEKFLEHSKTSIALIEALLLLCVGVLWWSGLPVFVRRAVERAGLGDRGISTHSTRRTFITRLIHLR
jgi:hypothetical protein